MAFHAAGDGETGDTKAFEETWDSACRDSGGANVYVPAGRTFLLRDATFNGPCKSPITMQVDGDIVAPSTLWQLKSSSVLTFHEVDNLTVDGCGQIDGRGAPWWDCYNHKLVSFSFCNGLRVTNVRLKDSALKHISVYRCSQALVHNVSISAPCDSPNTDGITIGASDHVRVSSSSIQSGDDCVSIITETTDVNITDIACGPGHGISVGSLGGAGEGPAMVERITVSNCKFFNTTSGVRIKSWQGGQGKANGFIFRDLNMTEVQHPIDIDQFYCPQGNCPERQGGVAITDARFINIHGTSSEREAIKIMCSESVPCHGIYLDNVDLSWCKHTAPPQAKVMNAHGSVAGMVKPQVRFLGR
ncbi:probable polygalacturonase At1g80170 [Aegilops tauschii subsp. strangulata]|uniref:Putative polygalacturonase n=1 Tax=Aegilops tauschii TaxID=37682 RepID=M8B2W0_AEGTA|nr:probable polygalacturonase At1g80170 [Triticum aestivum]